MDNSSDDSTSRVSEKDLSHNHNESKANVSLFNKINQFTAKNDSMVRVIEKKNIYSCY